LLSHQDKTVFQQQSKSKIRRSNGMTSCDVLIVGGGPAGSSCAWKLRGSGLNVLVLDKKQFPRDKPCAGWITPPVVDELQIDLDDYRRGRVLEPITGFGTGLIGGKEIVSAYGKTISYGIRRCEFDDYLLHRTKARLQLGEPLKTIERTNGHWVVNGRIKASLLVGAGGHFCPVARRLGAKPGAGELAVAAQEIEFEMTPTQLQECPIVPGVPYLYFCDDLQGYGWYYRKGNYLNVGLGREDDQRLSAHVDAFCEMLKAQGKIPRTLAGRFVGHAYLLYTHAPRQVVDDGVLLIGDAAGLAYPQSGEGIRPAVESGLMAANVIRGANGAYRRGDLQPYEAGLSARFGGKFTRSLSDFLPLVVKRFVAGKLMSWRWFARSVIVDHWFLHSQEPPLKTALAACAIAQ
jgi:flavin-dependent dehydrogenase